MTLGAIREALHKADPSASSPFLDAMICRGSQMDNAEWNLTDMVDYVEFTIHLKRGLVKRCNNYDPTAKFALPTVVAIQARAEKERLHRKAAVRKAAAEKLAMQAKQDGAKNRWRKLKDDGAKKDDATSGASGVEVGAEVGADGNPLSGNTQGGKGVGLGEESSDGGAGGEAGTKERAEGGGARQEEGRMYKPILVTAEERAEGGGVEGRCGAGVAE